jgi:hypothetical protein
MQTRIGKLLVTILIAGIGALLLTAGPSQAQVTPKLSGAYSLKVRRYCQPFFTSQQVPDPMDGDSVTYFSFPGSMKDQIGVVTFNPTAQTFSGSMIQLRGAVIFQDLSALGITTTNETFTTSTKSLSGSFSTTPTSFTISSTDGTTVFQAVYGAFSGSVAHVVIIATTTTDGNGDSCVESGELQFK